MPPSPDASSAALVNRLHRSAFDYFRLHTHPETGLVADTSLPGSPSSIATTGFGLSSYPVAIERGWMSRAEAAAIVLKTLRFFEGCDTGSHPDATGHRGFYYHFLAMHDGRRVWHSELSTIDTALLIAGVLTAGAYFDGSDPAETEIRDTARELYARVDWRWAMNKGDTLTMGWKTNRFIRHRWRGYNEALLLYILALASPTHPIPPESFAAYTASYQWLRYGEIDYIHAGPLFIHLFSHAWIDFDGIHDAYMREKGIDYVENTRRAIRIQRAYARDNPHGYIGYSDTVWGLTACDGPSARRRLRGGHRQHFIGYSARGAPFGPDDGTLAPWAALSCLPFDREAAMEGLDAILATYPNLLSDGRFPGSFNPTIIGPTAEGWIDERCVGLDQGLLVMMIENARSGLIWRLMRDSPPICEGLRRAGFSGGWLSAEQPASSAA